MLDCFFGFMLGTGVIACVHPFTLLGFGKFRPKSNKIQLRCVRHRGLQISPAARPAQVLVGLKSPLPGSGHATIHEERVLFDWFA